MVKAGGGDDWNALRNRLEASGWVVTPVEMEVVLERGDPTAEMPRLDGVALAILVVGSSETESNLQATRGLLFLTGLLQGKLGRRKVLVLVEDGVDAFLRGTGVPELSYKAGNIQSRFPQIVATLRDLDAGAPKGWLRAGLEQWLKRYGLQDTATSPAWLVAAGVLLLIVFLRLVYLFVADPVPSASDDAGGTRNGSVATVEDGTVSGADPGGTLVGSSDGVAGPVTTDPPIVPPVSGGELPGGDSGRVETLPTSCILSTQPDEVTPGRIACDGNGTLTASGFLGPWHQEISAVTLEQGVVGEAHMQRAPDDTSETRVQLNPGQRVELEPYGSAGGTERLELEFSANNQTVIVHQAPGRGGSELVLTFTLDL